MNTGELQQDTKERIRTCAIELFKEFGYENVTVVQICREADITKRTFYYHYDSKEQLLYGLIDYMGVKAEQLLKSLAAQQTNLGMLWELMSVYSFKSVEYGPNIIKQIYVLMMQGKGSADEHFPFSTYLYDLVVRTVINAQRAGEIVNPCPPEDIAFTLYHAFRSVVITWAAENGAFDLVDTYRKVFEVVLGIRRSGGNPEQG